MRTLGQGCGRVVGINGEIVYARVPNARIGNGVAIESDGGTIAGMVAALDDARVAIAPFGTSRGIAVGDRVREDASALASVCGYGALGRAVDACGRALDGREPLRGRRLHAIARAPEPGDRAPIGTPLWCGVPVIDALLTIGRGARVGLFGAPGCGKSTLLEAIVRFARADAIVVALIGERGREARQWIDTLDARTSIVCATSDRPASERVRAAHLAMAHACELRARGLDVLLVIDSLARFANAERERRSSLGEPVGRGGYPAAVWAELARYLECAGAAPRGSVTLIATVLSDGGDEREPLSDNARSLLDGHLVLSSALARAGRYPAIDVLSSASRTMERVIAPAHRDAARVVRASLARLSESEDARALGLITNPDIELAAALEIESDLNALLQIANANPEDTLAALAAIARRLATTAMRATSIQS